jgi:hypothetical protein
LIGGGAGTGKDFEMLQARRFDGVGYRVIVGGFSGWAIAGGGPG